MDRIGEQDVEVALRHVRPGVADVFRRPAALQGPQDLARRARIDADEVAQSRQGRGIRVRLEGEPDPMVQSCAIECGDQPLGVLGETTAVVDE